ncbi:DUF58 domain-containing protein [Pseudophaeobacter sp. EL27]|uniref:DUF58 domain-containing protein n=1 Tax=Pseudophaeobacter sp. EL27 TaxID=2107580 RepID=UPI000EFB6881|nr:DUF58 domain-containing protein [Pseudophaeobacter sp. EL27]
MLGSRDPRIHVDLAHLRGLKGRGRAISFRLRQPSHSILNGQHASKIKGRGLNFEELRHYAIGDDVRTIDWKVTARTGAPYVRVYTEERDRPVMLIVDQRMSMYFGSALNMKSVTAAEAAAVAAFRVRDKGDRVGGIIFDDQGWQEVRPQSSARSLNRFLDLLARANCRLNANAPLAEPIPLSDPIRAAARIVKSGALVIVFSDFDGWDPETEKNLRAIAQHNELILFSVFDPTSEQLPPEMNIVVSDGTLQAQVNIGDDTVRRKLADFSTGRLASLFRFSSRYAVPVVPLTSAQETLPQLLRLLGGRGGGSGIVR